MKTITLDKSELLAAYSDGNADQKEMLEHLFGKDMFAPNWREITSYEKACEVLGIRQIRIGETGERPQYMRMANAMQQLLVICEAINGNGKWFEQGGFGYFPDISLYDKRDMEEFSEAEYKRRGIHKLLASVYSSIEKVSGVSSHNVSFRYPSTTANYGLPLCLNSKEKAEFVGKQFFELCCQCYGITPKID